MNLVAWVLSLVIDWIRPLQPADPVLAGVSGSPSADDDADVDTDSDTETNTAEPTPDNAIVADAKSAHGTSAHGTSAHGTLAHGTLADTASADPASADPASADQASADQASADTAWADTASANDLPDDALPDDPNPVGTGSAGDHPADPEALARGTADGYAANAFAAEMIAAESMTADKAVADAVTADQSTADVVSAEKLAAGKATTEAVTAPPKPGDAAAPAERPSVAPADRQPSGRWPGFDPVGHGLPPENPLWTFGDRLLALIAPASAAPPGWLGWALMLATPALILALLQGLCEALGAFGGLLWLLLNALVLYFAVPAGRLVRRLQRLALMAAAGETAGMRAMVSRWVAGEAPVPAPEPDSAAAARSAFALPVIDGYRDVFAPLFWFVLLGPAAPIAYGFARLIAERRPGRARRALVWIDWIPVRLAAASLAFAGRFDDAMLGLRAGHDALSLSRADTSFGTRDPGQPLQLLLLPAAGGALGLRLADPSVERALQEVSPEHEPPEGEPSAAAFSALYGLLGRVAMMWLALWLLVHLVS